MNPEVELILTAPAKDMQQFCDLLKSFKEDCNEEEQEMLQGIIDAVDTAIKNG